MTTPTSSKPVASHKQPRGENMKLLPQRKTLVGYARKITKAHSTVQLQILRDSYTARLESSEIEVLDYLCHYKRLTLEASERLGELAAEARSVLPSRSEIDLEQFVRRGMRAQAAAAAVIDKYTARGGG